MGRLARWGRGGLAGLVCALAISMSGAAQSQEIGLPSSAILTISSERLFAESRFGKKVEESIEDAGRALAAENRQIEADLSAEEKELTEQRPEMAPEAFRTLADAFDEKVQSIRKAQDAKARALTQEREEARALFFDAARPVLSELMREAGAGVILERSSVFLSANATDVTALAISRIDAALEETAPQENAE